MQPRRGADGGGPVGGTASTVRRSEGRSGAGVALRAVRRQAESRVAQREIEIGMLVTGFPGTYTIRRVSGLLNHGSSSTTLHRPHKHSDHPQRPHLTQRPYSHNNYLPLGVVFVPENQVALSAVRGPLVFTTLSLVLCGLVSFDHLVEFLSTPVPRLRRQGTSQSTTPEILCVVGYLVLTIAISTASPRRRAHHLLARALPLKGQTTLSIAMS